MFGHLYPVLMKTKGEYPTDVFFLDTIPVIPPKFRPVNFVDGVMSENGHSKILSNIIKNVKVLRIALCAHKGGDPEVLTVEAKKYLDAIQGKSLLAKLQSAWLTLQQTVDMITDTSANKDDISMKGFRQVFVPSLMLFLPNLIHL